MIKMKNGEEFYCDSAKYRSLCNTFEGKKGIDLRVDFFKLDADTIIRLDYVASVKEDR